ncbi:MAG: hypothetical protein QXP81_07470 [Nitrososphaerota archaeon]
MRRSESGLSVAVQTAAMIVITVAIAGGIVALWRPWETGSQVQAGDISYVMQNVHEAVLRREGSVLPRFSLTVYPLKETHKVEIEWNGNRMPVMVSVSTIEYHGDKMRLPGVYFLDKGSVDVLGTYIADRKRNYTVNGVDTVSYVEYDEKGMKYVVKALPYVNVAVDRAYHDVVVNVMIRFVVLAPYPLNAMEFPDSVKQGYTIGAGQMITLRMNNTYRFYMQQPESVGGGTLRLYFDGEPILNAQNEALEVRTTEHTIVRVFVDMVVLNVWGR